MACIYKLNGKTITKERLEEFIRANPEFQPKGKQTMSDVFKSFEDLTDKIEDELSDVPEEIRDRVRKLMTNTSRFKLTDNEKNYFEILNPKNLLNRVTSLFKEAIPEDKKTDVLKSSQKIGTKIDKMFRDFFNDELTDDFEGYGLASKEEFDKTLKQVKDLKAHFDKTGQTVIKREVFVYDQEAQVGGTVDLITYDKQGNIRIYDMKTQRKSKFGEAHSVKYNSTKYGMSNKESHQKQLSLYRILANNTEGLNAVEAFVIPIETDYEDVSETTKSADILPLIPVKLLDSVGSVSLKEAKKPKELLDEDKKRLRTTILKQIDKLKARLLEFESAKERKGFLPKDETVVAIQKLEKELNELEDVEAFFKNADFISKELKDVVSFLNTKYNPKNKNHIYFLLQIEKQMEYYKEFAELIPLMSAHKPDMLSLLNNIENLYSNTHNHINQLIEAQLVDFEKSESGEKLTDEDFIHLLRNMKDISWQEAKFGGMSNSMSKLLQLLHKHVEIYREEVYDRTNNWQTKISTIVKKLKDAGIKSYDWMLQKDEKGNKTGGILNKVSSVYYKVRKDLINTLFDKHGVKREYFKGDLDSLTDEQIKHNIELSNDKKKVSEFFQAEILDEFGAHDGENHKYTDEFKKLRSFYYTLKTNDEGTYSQWVKRPYSKFMTDGNNQPLSEEQYNKNYDLFKSKYFETKVVQSMTYNKQGLPTGVIKEVEKSIARKENVEVITSTIDASGRETTTKFGDPEFYKLMNNNTAEGKLKREFYEFYTKSAAELLDKVPVGVKHKMTNKMFRIKNSLIKDIKTIGIANTFIKTVREWVNPDVVFSTREVAEDGSLLEDVPIFFTSDLKNNKKIETLTLLLSDLQKELISDPTNQDISSKIKKAKNQLLIEENKLTADELEVDLEKSLIKFAHMAENYDLMKEAEGLLLLAKNYMKNNTRFYNINSAGQEETLGKGESNVEKRLSTYMRMIFYSNSTKNQTKIAKLIQNFNSGVSVKTLGGNPFSAINNAIMAQINNRIEAFGKQFGYTNEDLNQAQKEVYTYIAGGSYLKNMGQADYLKVPQNKFEAMLKHMNWLDKNQIIDEASPFNELMFIGITGGEFIAQSSSAIAKIRSVKLKNSKTGKEVNLWDAYEFKNGELKLIDGFEHSSLEKRKLSVDIKNMNKMIHGNYSQNDKVAMQESALGQSAMMFKKWMYNFGKSRWGNKYYDETVKDFQEGRYVTIKNIVQTMFAAGIYDIDGVKKLYGSLADYQKSNMKKAAVELMYWVSSYMLYTLLSAIAEGLDDDDDELRLVVNFLRRQSDRIGGELDVFINPITIHSNIQSPIAGTRMLHDFGQFLAESAKLPINYFQDDTEELYVQKGPNKGMYVWTKEARDLIPVWNLKSQWNQLNTSGNYFMGK